MADSEIPDQGGGKSKTDADILVVEDSIIQARKLRLLLEKHGYRISIALNGLEAMAVLEDFTPDLIISDVVMPEMDGLELCRRIRSHERLRFIPVLLLTALSEPEDIIRGLESGADNFLTKPYDEAFLIKRINYILVNQEIRQNPRSDMGIEIYFAGKHHFINSDRIQILDLLMSAYENALQHKRELERVNKELKEAVETIQTLHGILPICSHCKKIRDENDQWEDLENFISRKSEAKFSHGICPECRRILYPDVDSSEPENNE